MVEVTHKGRTTSWTVNKAIPFLKEFNQRVTEWRTVPPLLDIWIYYRARNKNIIMEFGIMYLPGYPLLPLGSKSPIFGIPRIQKYIEGPSCGIFREVVPQVISVPYNPCSIENDPAQDAISRRKVIQERGHGDAHQPEVSATIISTVPITDMNGCSKASDSPSTKKKGLPQGSGVIDKENQPAKVARHVQAMVADSEVIRGAEEDPESR